MSGRIVVVASSKGGSGKTTLVTLLAIVLGELRHPLAIIDSDPNETLTDWLTVYEGPPVGNTPLATPEGIVDHANKAAEAGYDVIVDTAGFGSIAAATAIAAADAVLIPVMADRGSVREALRTHDLVRRVGNERTLCYAVFSQWSPRGLAEGAALEDIKAAGVECLTQHIPDMAAFRQLSFTGAVPGGRPFEVGLQLAAELIARNILTRHKSKRGTRT